MLTNVYMKTSFFQASYVHILSSRCWYICRCGCVNVHMQTVFPYASACRTRALILNVLMQRLLVVFTTVRLLKPPLNTKISKTPSKALFTGDSIHP